MPFSLQKVEEIEAHLTNNPYLTEGGLPGVEDARILLALNKVSPDVTKTPHFHHWFNFVNAFSDDLLHSWVEKADGKKEEKPAKKQEKKKEEKKEEKKVETKSAEDDLFGDDPVDAAPAPKPEVKKPEPKKKKEKPIAKSIVIFDVKVYEKETNLDELAAKILALKIDGLTWNNQPKKVAVAYGMQKLQIGCVIEDDKVLTDDIFEPIEDWPEVQSVDMTSMQKL